MKMTSIKRRPNDVVMQLIKLPCNGDARATSLFADKTTL